MESCLVEEKCLVCGKMVAVSALRDPVEVCRDAERLYNEQKEKERRSATPPPLQSPLPPMQVLTHHNLHVCSRCHYNYTSQTSFTNLSPLLVYDVSQDRQVHN